MKKILQPPASLPTLSSLKKGSPVKDTLNFPLSLRKGERDEGAVTPFAHQFEVPPLFPRAASATVMVNVIDSESSAHFP